MKRIFFTLGFVIAIQSLIAQNVSGETSVSPTSQNNFFVTPNISYIYPFDMPSGYKNFDMSFNIDEGYFILNNLAIVGTIGVNYSKTTVPESTTTGSMIGYYTSYVNGKAYLMPYNKSTTETTASYSNSFTEFTYGAGLKYYIDIAKGNFFIGSTLLASKAKGYDTSCNVYLHVGYAAFISKQIALEPSVGYLMGIGDASGNKALQAKIGVGFYFSN